MKLIELYDDVTHKKISERMIRTPDGQGQMFVIFKNPSRAEFRELTSSETADLKGLVDGKDLYCWAAWHAHHHQIANAFGIEHPIRIFIQHNAIIAHESFRDIIVNMPIIKYLYNDNVPFYPE